MDRNIINIYITLLNRRPSNTEINSSLNLSTELLKRKIKNSNEFKNFNKHNLIIIKNIFCDLLNINDININLSPYLLYYIKSKYNKIGLKTYIKNTIDDIESKYKFIYRYYLALEEIPSKEELINILNDSKSCERIIVTSDKFLQKSNDKINELNKS